MPEDEELFGPPEKIALAKRSRYLYSLLCEDPRFAFYGRLVGLSCTDRESGDIRGTARILGALARIQGASVAYFFPASLATSLFAELEEGTLATDRHEHFRGGEDALTSSRRILENNALPGNLRVVALDAESPRALVSEVAELCQSCDVMPVPGPVMRGQDRPGVCLAALDRAGRAVATASSYALHHPASPHVRDVFWGMLATREDRRGERIALILGAQAIVHMWERQGARGFMTGIRADNASSQALCNKLGVRATDWIYASCMDTELLGAASITK